MAKKWEIKEPIEFLCESNFYLINGKKYWRVTRVKGVINQPGLNAWRASIGSKEANKIMKIRQNHGTKVHKLVEIILDGNTVNLDNYGDEVRKDVKCFESVIKNCELDVEAVEQHLWNDEWLIAGTADYIGKYKSYKDYLPKNIEPKFTDKSHVIGDWKTSSGIFEDYWLQLASYVATFELLTGIKLDGAFIAQVRDGKIRVEEKSYDELMRYWWLMQCLIPVFSYTQGELPNEALLNRS